MDQPKMTKHGVVAAENIPVDAKDQPKQAGRPATGDDQFSQLIDARRTPCSQPEAPK